MSVKDRVATGVSEVRERGPVVAHLLRMVQHYGKVNAKLHSGAITFFGFLSLFPLLALTFLAVGYAARLYPDLDDQIRAEIEDAVPGLVGEQSGQISLDQVSQLELTSWGGLLGVAGVLFTGLGFIQVLRVALMYVFERPIPQRNFVLTKITDLLGLVTVGGTLLLSIALGSVLTRFSGALLRILGIDDELSWVLTLLGASVGMLVNVVLFVVMFRQLGRSTAPIRALAGGALLGAVGFEVLKQAAPELIALTKGNPAFQAFGIALVLVVVLNYFARLVLYAASWAHTSPGAMAVRSAPTGLVQGPQLPPMSEYLHPTAAAAHRRAARLLAPFAAGGATMLALVAALRRRGDR